MDNSIIGRRVNSAIKPSHSSRSASFRHSPSPPTDPLDDSRRTWLSVSRMFRIAIAAAARLAPPRVVSLSRCGGRHVRARVGGRPACSEARLPRTSTDGAARMFGGTTGAQSASRSVAMERVSRAPRPSPPPSARDIDRGSPSGTFASSLCGTDERAARFTLWHLPGATSEPFDAFFGLRYCRHSFVAATHCDGLPSRVGRKVNRNRVGVVFAYHRRKPPCSSIRPRSIASSIVCLISRRGICHDRMS